MLAGRLRDRAPRVKPERPKDGEKQDGGVVKLQHLAAN